MKILKNNKENGLICSLLIFVLLFTNCKHTNKSNELNSNLHTLKLVESVENISDSIFFSDIKSLQTVDEYLLFSDYEQDLVFILNEQDWTKVNIFGESGRAAGEFLGAQHITVYKDTIYIVNEGALRLDKFNYAGEYFGSIEMEGAFSQFSVQRFIVSHGKIYLSLYDGSGKSVQCYNLNGKYLGSGVDEFNFNNLTQNRIRNKRHLFEYKNYFVSVSDNLPLIELYSQNFVKVFQLNIDNCYNEFSNLVIFSKNQDSKIKENQYFNLIQDIYVFQDVLYLLVYTSKDEIGEEKDRNTILKFSLSDDKIKYRGALRLTDNNWYSSFCVGDKFLFTFNSSNSKIEKFNLID